MSSAAAPLENVFRPSRFAAWAGVLVTLYVLSMGLTRALWWLTTGPLSITPRPLPAEQNLAFCVAFFLFFTPLLYGLPSLLARQWLRPHWKTVLFYAGVGYGLGCGLELTMDPLWILVTGRPCYLYETWPIHGGYTSGSGIIMWPMYGFFVCMLHEAIRVNPSFAFMRGTWAKAALLAVDAMLLEVAANVFALWGFGSWMFRYHAPDLAHFTTIEAFPIYLFGGAAGVWFLHALENHRARHVMGVVLYVVVAALAFGLDARG